MRRLIGYFLLALALVGCSTGGQRLALPQVQVHGQGVPLDDLAALDAMATAVAVVQPTGKSRIDLVVVDEFDLGTPFPVVELRVIELIKGDLPPVIELRQGYTYVDDKGQEIPVVSGSAQFLLYLEPYSLGDGKPWNGEWVTSAWLSGVYMDLGVDSGTFTRLDPDREALPDELTVDDARRLTRG